MLTKLIICGTLMLSVQLSGKTVFDFTKIPILKVGALLMTMLWGAALLVVSS